VCVSDALLFLVSGTFDTCLLAAIACLLRWLLSPSPFREPMQNNKSIFLFKKKPNKRFEAVITNTAATCTTTKPSTIIHVRAVTQKLLGGREIWLEGR